MRPVFPTLPTAKRPPDPPWSYWDDEPVEDGPDHAVVQLLLAGHYRGPSTPEERYAAARRLEGWGFSHGEIDDRLCMAPGHAGYLLRRWCERRGRMAS